MKTNLDVYLEKRFDERFDMPLNFDSRINKIVKDTALLAYMNWYLQSDIDNEAKYWPLKSFTI